MKKFFILYILLISTLFAQADIPQLRNYATDFTGTLSNNELSHLNRELKNFEDTTSNQVVFVMISALNNYPIEMYAYEVASKNKIGTAENNNGVLFLVAKNDRKMRIEVGYGLEGALPDALASSIIRNEVAPYFRKGDYYGGIEAGLKAIKLATVGEYTRERIAREDDEGGGFPIVYIIIFILMSIFSRFGRGRGGGLAGLILLGGLSGGHSRGGGFGSSGGGFGGFSGGGGSFGGGGASGGW